MAFFYFHQHNIPRTLHFRSFCKFLFFEQIISQNYEFFNRTQKTPPTTHSGCRGRCALFVVLRSQVRWEQRYLSSASCAHTKYPSLPVCCKARWWWEGSAHLSLGAKVRGVSTAYISANFPVPCALFKSRRVLFCQLLCSVKKREKYCACLTAEKQKTGAGAVWSTVPTPVSAVFSYIEGCFAPKCMKKPLLSW